MERDSRRGGPGVQDEGEVGTGMTRLTRLTNSTTGGPVFVDVGDGKIVRILPIDLDDSDASWKIEARGRTFSPPRRTTLSPWTVAHKSAIYSPKRILTPLKRVDFDPNGSRNCQNRGVSGYEPIGWDEAFDLVADEIQRIKRELGPAAMLSTPARTTCGAMSATASAPTTGSWTLLA